MDENTLITTAAVLLVAILFTIFMLRKGGFWRDRVRKTILLVGPSDTGKTYLVSKLYRQYQKEEEEQEMEIETVISIEATAWILPSQKHTGPIQNVRIVDLPGHPRLAWKLDEWVKHATVVLFIMDSQCLSLQIKQAAEVLYNLLTHPSIVKRKIPVKIICNKSDLDDAKDSSQACTLLEKELDLIRTSKSSDMLDQELEEKEYLGYEGEVFSFDHVVNPISWKSMSFKQDEVDLIELYN